MRVTVKTKLASAFGVIIMLSAVAGGVAYNKLNMLASNQEQLVAQAGRIEKIGALQNAIQGTSRMEKNAILASTDAEVDGFNKTLLERRAKALTLKDELYASANEQGKALLDQAGAKLAKQIETQDRTIKLTKLNSNIVGGRIWAAEGTAAVRDFDTATGALLAEIAKSQVSAKTAPASLALELGQIEAARLQGLVYEMLAATSVETLEAADKSLIAQFDTAKQELTKASASVSGLGLSPAALTTSFDKLRSVARLPSQKLCCLASSEHQSSSPLAPPSGFRSASAAAFAVHLLSPTPWRSGISIRRLNTQATTRLAT
jgi:methyl-accepting chemotaxis protein